MLAHMHSQRALTAVNIISRSYLVSAESYVKIRKLTVNRGEPVEDIIQRAAEHLSTLSEKAVIQIRVIGGDTGAKVVHSVHLTPAGAFLHADNTQAPSLVVITTVDMFHRMAEGSYSPVQAYLDGKLKLQGNVELGKRMILHLAESGSQVNVCPFFASETWQPDGRGGGLLTLTGSLFTPGGTVDVRYDWGGGFYRQIVTADSSGSFTVTQFVFCGDIPGQPGVGVTVTASDLSTGQSTSKGYSTPCG